METLQATPRTEVKRSVNRGLRESGRIPAIIYGKNTPSTPLYIEENEFSKLIRDHGNNVLLHLSWNNQKTTVMVGDIQTHVLKDTILHVDFQEVNMTQKTTVEVPLEWVGEEIITKRGQVLQKQIHALEVECLPADIPEAITIDVSTFEIGDSVTIQDLQPGDNIDIVEDIDTVLASVQPPALEEDPEEPQVDEHVEPELVDAEDGPGLDEAK